MCANKLKILRRLSDGLSHLIWCGKKVWNEWLSSELVKSANEKHVYPFCGRVLCTKMFMWWITRIMEISITLLPVNVLCSFGQRKSVSIMNRNEFFSLCGMGYEFCWEFVLTAVSSQMRRQTKSTQSERWKKRWQHKWMNACAERCTQNDGWPTILRAKNMPWMWLRYWLSDGKWFDEPFKSSIFTLHARYANISINRVACHQSGIDHFSWLFRSWPIIIELIGIMGRELRMANDYQCIRFSMMIDVIKLTCQVRTAVFFRVANETFAFVSIIGGRAMTFWNYFF